MVTMVPTGTLGPYEVGETFGQLPVGSVVMLRDRFRSFPLVGLILADALARESRCRTAARRAVSRAFGRRHDAFARPVEVREAEGQMAAVYELPSAGRWMPWPGAVDPGGIGRSDDLILPLAEALDTAHQRGLMHGLLAPPAILVDEAGTVTIVGLGLLQSLDEAGLVNLLGDVDRRYAAPEQTTEHRVIASADGYALGMLARDLLVGAGAPRDPSQAATISAIERQCSAEPTDRFTTCAEFARALAGPGDRISVGTATSSHGPTPAPVAPVLPVGAASEGEESPAPTGAQNHTAPVGASLAAPNNPHPSPLPEGEGAF